MPYPIRRGGGGGTGSLIVATRSDNNNPAVFADIAARDTYTATTEGTADAARINVTNADDAREVFAVGTLDGSNQVTAITAAYIRLNGVWTSVATNLVGTPGAPGQDGANALDVQFTSETARDDFFSLNPTLLRSGLPVLVRDSTTVDNVVEPQVWTGPDMPSTYDPATDAVFFRPATVRADSSSFELGGIHRLTSGGENVYTENLNTSVSYAPPWQSVGDHSTPAGRVVNNRPDAREWGAFQQVELQGPVAPSGSVDFNVPFNITTANLSVFGVKFEIAETYTGIATLNVDITQQGGLLNLTNRIFEIDATDGDEVMLWLRSPLDARMGTNTTVQLVKPDGSFVASRPQTANPTLTWTEVSFRTFTDVPMAFQSEVGGQVDSITEGFLISVDDTDPANPEVSVGFSLGTGLSLDNTDPDNPVLNSTGATAIQDEGVQVSASPTAINFAGNGVVATESGGVVTVTISGGGGTTPGPGADNLYFGLSTSNNPADVVISSLTQLDPTDPQTISTGAVTQGDYFIILNPNTHPIQRITDVPLGNVVYTPSGGATNVFQFTADVRTESSVTLNALVIGPLNAGDSEDFVVEYS